MYYFIVGASIILIIGGRSEACSALDDCWLLNVDDYSLKKVSHTTGVIASSYDQGTNQCMVILCSINNQ